MISNQPLYIVDDKVVEDFNNASLAPDSIDSIQVLRTLSAIAIYGKAGQNGVILITTKKYASEKSKKAVN